MPRKPENSPKPAGDHEKAIQYFEKVQGRLGPLLKRLGIPGEPATLSQLIELEAKLIRKRRSRDKSAGSGETLPIEPAPAGSNFLEGDPDYNLARLLREEGLRLANDPAWEPAGDSWKDVVPQRHSFVFTIKRCANGTASIQVEGRDIAASYSWIPSLEPINEPWWGKDNEAVRGLACALLREIFDEYRPPYGRMMSDIADDQAYIRAVASKLIVPQQTGDFAIGADMVIALAPEHIEIATPPWRPVWPEAGEKLLYKGRNDYPYTFANEQENAKKNLIEGKTYTLKQLDVRPSSVGLTLRETGDATYSLSFFERLGCPNRVSPNG